MTTFLHLLVIVDFSLIIALGLVAAIIVGFNLSRYPIDDVFPAVGIFILSHIAAALLAIASKALGI